MELETTFVASMPPGEARQQVGVFLGMAGFLATDAGNPLGFRRSGTLATVFASGPQRWRCDATVWIRRHGEGGSELRVRYDVSTLGQLVTDAERAFFAAELRELGAALGATAAGPSSRTLAREATDQTGAIVRGEADLIAAGVNPRVVGGLLSGGALLLAGIEYVSLREGEYHPKVLILMPPAFVLGVFMLVAGAPERGADGAMPGWWQAGRAVSIAVGLVASGLLFWRLG